MMIPFSPLSSTRSLNRRRDGGFFPMFLFLTVVVAFMGWLRVWYVSSELSDAQAHVVQLQAKLAAAEQSLAQEQAKPKVEAVADQSMPTQKPIPVVLPVYSETTPTSNTTTNVKAPEPAKPSHSNNLPDQTSRSSSRPYSR